MAKKYRQKNKKGKNYKQTKEGCLELKCSNGSKRVTLQQLNRRHFPRNRIEEVVVHTKLSNFPKNKMSNSHIKNIRFHEHHYTKEQIKKEENKIIYCTINDGDFSNCNNLTQLYIPRGHLVKKGAFSNCENLYEVTINEDSQIEEGAFPKHTNIMFQ